MLQLPLLCLSKRVPVARSSKQHDPKLTKIMSIINQQKSKGKTFTYKHEPLVDFVRTVLVLILAVKVVSVAQHDIFILIFIF